LDFEICFYDEFDYASACGKLADEGFKDLFVLFDGEFNVNDSEMFMVEEMFYRLADFGVIETIQG
jgi:hypothetical protein